MRKQPKPGRRSEIALVVIARNEAGCIERCLRSAKPHVDRMIVLDTGSTDETIAMAEGPAARRSTVSRGSMIFPPPGMPRCSSPTPTGTW